MAIHQHKQHGDQRYFGGNHRDADTQQCATDQFGFLPAEGRQCDQLARGTAAPLVVGNLPAAVGGVIVEYAGQCGLGALGADTNFVPTWTINTANDLILGDQIGSGATYSTPGAGNFGSWSANPDPTILSDGNFGVVNNWPNVGGSQTECTCGVSPAGASMTYTLDTSITGSTNGYDVTNIVVYGGWGDGGRNEQKYEG